MPELTNQYREATPGIRFYLARLAVVAGNAYTIIGLGLALIIPFLPIGSSIRIGVTTATAFMAILIASYRVWREAALLVTTTELPTITIDRVKTTVQSYAGGRRMPTSPWVVSIEFTLANRSSEQIVFRDPRMTDVAIDEALFVREPARTRVIRAGHNAAPPAFPLQVPARSSQPGLILEVSFAFRNIAPERLAEGLGRLNMIHGAVTIDYSLLSGQTAVVEEKVTIECTELLTQMRRFWSGSKSDDLIALSGGEGR